MIEFLKVILTPHIVWGGILIFFAFRFKHSFSQLLNAITDRVKNVQEYKKTKDGHELTFSDSQSDKQDELLPNISESPPEGAPEKIDGSIWPEDNTNDIEKLREFVKGERAARYLWEYSFLNLFLVRHSQHVLDWFSSLESPPTMNEYHQYWQNKITPESEREAVITALSAHSLIESINGDKIHLTPKGEEYRNWRGSLPPLQEENSE